MSENIKKPLGWITATIKDFAANEKYAIVDGPFGTQMKVHEFVSSGIPLIEMQNIDEDKFVSTFRRFITKEKFEEIKRSAVKGGDVLISKTGSLGYTAIVPEEIKQAIITSRLAKISIDWRIIDRKFLLQYLLFLREKGHWSKIAKGTTMKILNIGQLADTECPIPPLPEQHRIVAKIEELSSSLDKGIESLKTAQQQLKVYRQAVLKWAFEGRLTEEWRKQQKDLPTVLQLFEQITTERQKQAKATGKNLKPAVPITQTKLTELPTLPDGWCWMTPDILSAIDSNSICAGPFGTIFKAKDFRESGIPIIFLRHVKAGQYKTEKPGFMDGNKWKELFTSYSVFGGELLITKLGDPPGECAIYPTGIGPAMVTPDIIKMSANKTIVIPKFLMYYFNSEVSKRLSQDTAFGTTRLRVTIPIFRGSPTVFCSIEEQDQIVQEIESRSSVCDKIEESVEQSLKQAESLRQSILKKAFEGKLVPQDPNDEPASGLLERIRAERVLQQVQGKNKSVKKIRTKKEKA